MPRNGYWIECVPVSTTGNGSLKNETSQPSPDNREKGAGSGYRAVVSSIPGLDVVAQTPDQAIDKLRQKLVALKKASSGSDPLPETDNPVRPPKNLRSVPGWISVYLQFSDQCSAH